MLRSWMWMGLVVAGCGGPSSREVSEPPLELAALPWAPGQPCVPGVWWRADEDNVLDRTAHWAKGTEAYPAEEREGGDFHVCGGDWYVTLAPQSATRVFGLDGATLVTSSNGSVVEGPTDASELELTGIGIHRAEGAAWAVDCRSYAPERDIAPAVSLRDLTVTIDGDEGPALRLDDCGLHLDGVTVNAPDLDDVLVDKRGLGEITVDDSTVIGNFYSQGFVVNGGGVTVTNSELSGAAFAVSRTGGSVSLIDTVMTDTRRPVVNTHGRVTIDGGHFERTGGLTLQSSSIGQVTHSTFLDNVEPVGALFQLDDADLTVSQSTIVGTDARDAVFSVWESDLQLDAVTVEATALRGDTPAVIAWQRYTVSASSCVFDDSTPTLFDTSTGEYVDEVDPSAGFSCAAISGCQ